MKQLRLRAVFMRGGTSKAIMFRAADLPADRSAWAPLFLGALGSLIPMAANSTEWAAAFRHCPRSA
jgi:2-methylaconitate isomerase